MNKLSIILLGFGNIGKAFYQRVEQQKEALSNTYKIELEFLLILRSSSYQKNGEWLDLSNGEELLRKTFQDYPDKRYVIVDCTASEKMYDMYIAVENVKAVIIAANKAPLAVDFSKYLRLKDHLRTHKITFFHEATVGAGLPIVKPLNALIEAGDTVHSIEGVLSGTLTYLFAKSEPPFSARVKSAYDLGYTEPDPRIDLSGLDVARKCLVLARMIGSSLSLSDVKIESLVSKDLEKFDVDQFFDVLPNYDSTMANRENEANSMGEQLCYMGKVSKNVIEVGLFTVKSNSEFYGLSGTSNLLQITSDYYLDGYTIKGPGAGIEVTVNGLFSDFLQAIVVQK
jgi:aspartokinase/homoserine dehydrogenase 1